MGKGTYITKTWEHDQRQEEGTHIKIKTQKHHKLHGWGREYTHKNENTETS